MIDTPPKLALTDPLESEDRIRHARQRLASGFYDRPEVIHAAVDRLTAAVVLEQARYAPRPAPPFRLKT